MKIQTRKNFIVGGISLAAVALVSIFKTKSKKSTVKMLTKDGRLVEIDFDKLPATKRTASKEELITWINPKQL